MKTIVRLCAGALVAAGLATHAGAQGTGPWVEIGRTSVGDTPERKFISARDEGRFTQIRACVRHRAIDFQDFQVLFGNGGRQDFRILRYFRPDECTRPLDLRRGSRGINRISMRFETIHEAGRQAVVVVYGR